MSRDRDLRGVTNPDMRRAIKAALDAGIRHRMTKSGILFYGENGVDCVPVHKTSSDHRAYRNMLAQFRKIGFDPLQKRAKV